MFRMGLVTIKKPEIYNETEIKPNACYFYNHPLPYSGEGLADWEIRSKCLHINLYAPLYRKFLSRIASFLLISIFLANSSLLTACNRDRNDPLFIKNNQTDFTEAYFALKRSERRKVIIAIGNLESIIDDIVDKQDLKSPQQPSKIINIIIDQANSNIDESQEIVPFTYVAKQVTGQWQIVLIPDDKHHFIQASVYGIDSSTPMLIKRFVVPYKLK